MSRNRPEDSAAIVFLDVDGPVIPARMHLCKRKGNWLPPSCPSALAILDRLCRKAGARIVMNSSHNQDVDGITHAQRILGRTARHLHPDWRTAYPYGLDDYQADLTRQGAVHAWLRAHRSVRRYVVFDDLRLPMRRAIWVDPETGLSLVHYRRCQKWLGFSDPCLVLI